MKVEKILKNLSMEQLLDQWELTTNNDDENICIVRGWLMDEIEKRNPEGYDAWMSSEEDWLYDNKLRQYVA